MKPTILWEHIKYLSVLATLLVSGCATTMQMQMSPEELKKLQPNEGIVIGSVQIKGGKDLLGRTKWSLAAKQTNNADPEYTIAAHRDGAEEFFATKMIAGDYHIFKLYQEGFSTFTVPTDIQFKVEPGKTEYLGRLVIEFPPGFITVMTPIKIAVEDAKEEVLDSLTKKAGLAVSDVATNLMMTTVTVPQTSGTGADAILQSDVMRMIGMFESAGGGSKQPIFISASGAGKSGTTVIEHWIVDSNGKKVTYEVTFTPSPQGGVDFRVARLPSQ